VGGSNASLIFACNGNAIWPRRQCDIAPLCFPESREYDTASRAARRVKQDGVTRVPKDYRQLARDCHKIAAFSTRNNRTALLEMAREWDRLADQDEGATDFGKKDQIA
jgi:hypothetical protein